MADMEKAKVVYEGLCNALTHAEWKFKRFDEDLAIGTGAQGDDLPISFIVSVDANRDLVLLLSKMDFEVKEDKRMEMAVAITVVNNKLANGNFDLDLGNGTLAYRMALSYRGSILGREAYDYLIHASVSTIDEFNEKFLALATDMMDLEKFLEVISKEKE